MLTDRKMLPCVLKILHGPLMFFRGGTGGEGSQILAFARFGVFLSRIEAIFAGFEFAYHAGHAANRVPIQTFDGVGCTQGAR